MENNDKNVFINVPQGCYAVINETTPQNIKGLLTTDLNICTCIIVMGKSHKNMVLAHVDGNHTNLLDPECGLLHWLELIPAKEVEIEIYYGKKQNENTGQNNLYNSIYEEQINFINELMKKHNINKNITIIPVEHKHGYGSGACVVCRNETDYKEIQFFNSSDRIGGNDGIAYSSNSNIEAVASIVCEKDVEECIIRLDNLKEQMSTQFLQDDRLVDRYNEKLTNFDSNMESLLFQLTYMIYE